ncbi:unnamed protein product, partial [marine sediment metagenome]
EDTMTSFSSRGPRVDSGAPQKPNIVAPGSAIISARDQDVYLWPGGANAYFIDNDGLNLDGSGPADYYVMQGTSMACPIAAGVAALILDKNPGWTPAQVKTALESTATDKGDAGWDTIYGYGLIDALAALGDITPPTVTSTSPVADATGVAVGTTVSVTFSEAMDASTITTGSFTLDSVAGSVSYDSGTYTATFTPNENLSRNAVYTATLSTDITDAAGNPLASAYSWSFTTADVIPGDANGDGSVNALDITKVERIIAGLDAQTPGADAN